jgi:hypothetical protein
MALGKRAPCATPDATPVTSRIAEIHELGGVIAVAQRSIWSFARSGLLSSWCSPRANGCSPAHANSASSAFASFRSTVSKPSVNQP